MTLKADMLTDLDNVFFDTDEFVDSITYTPSGGDPVSITAMLEDMDPSIMDVAPPGDSMVLHVKYSDVANPQRGDTFTISSETWYLVKNLGGGSHEGAWKLEVTRSDRRQI